MRDLHPLAVFETAPFNHLGTSPVVVLYHKSHYEMLIIFKIITNI